MGSNGMEEVSIQMGGETLSSECREKRGWERRRGGEEAEKIGVGERHGE